LHLSLVGSAAAAISDQVGDLFSGLNLLWDPV